jgi:hypothetical protein
MVGMEKEVVGMEKGVGQGGDGGGERRGWERGVGEGWEKGVGEVGMEKGAGEGGEEGVGYVVGMKKGVVGMKRGVGKGGGEGGASGLGRRGRGAMPHLVPSCRAVNNLVRNRHVRL